MTKFPDAGRNFSLGGLLNVLSADTAHHDIVAAPHDRAVDGILYAASRATPGPLLRRVRRLDSPFHNPPTTAGGGPSQAVWYASAGLRTIRRVPFPDERPDLIEGRNEHGRIQHDA